MRKGLLTSLFALVFALSLAACGRTTEESTTSTTTEDAETTVQEESSSKTSATESSAKEEEKAYQRGVVEGNTYRNEFFGFTFSCPEDFTFLDDEGLAQMSNQVGEILSDNEEIQEALESGVAIYDMQASSTDGRSVNFVVEKTNALAGLVYDTEAYRKKCQEGLVSGFESMGVEITSSEDTTVTIGGTEFTSEDLTLSYNGIELYERLIFFKQGSCFGVLTLTGYSPEQLDEMVSNISLI